MLIWLSVDLLLVASH